MCKHCKDKGFTDDQIADYHDGEFEQRQAYLERLAADIGPDELEDDYDEDGDAEYEDEGPHTCPRCGYDVSYECSCNGEE